jgi:hypothetical protein
MIFAINPFHALTLCYPLFGRGAFEPEGAACSGG